MKNDNLIEHADQSALLNTQKWTPEPWFYVPNGFNPATERLTGSEFPVVRMPGAGEAIVASLGAPKEECEGNAQRIVACVNSMAGIQEPEKAIQGAREALNRIVHSPGVTDDERNQARAALKQLGGKL